MKSNFSPQAVLLDMDGLMLDTERPTIDLWSLAGKQFNYDIPRAVVLQIMGLNSGSIRGVFIKEYGAQFPYEQIRGEVKNLTRNKFEQEGIALRPGLTQLLDCLDERKIPYAIATSTNRNSALWELEKARIAERFSVVVCGNEVANGKPAPDIFLTAAKKLGVPPNHCVGFEDSGPGLLALQSAGIPSVFVQDVAQPSAETLAAVWRQYPSLAEAAEIFYGIPY